MRQNATLLASSGKRRIGPARIATSNSTVPKSDSPSARSSRRIAIPATPELALEVLRLAYGSPVRSPIIAQKPRLFTRRSYNPHPWDRRQHRHFLGRQRGSAASLGIRGARPHRIGGDFLEEPEPNQLTCVWARFSRLA